MFPSIVVADDAQPTVVAFDGLCDHTRTITTSSPQAQQFFNQGLAFLFAFNHDEAIRAFEQAGRLDPSAAMPHWGVAYACGPNINYPLVDEDNAIRAWNAVRRAQELAAGGTAVERDLIAALAKRYVLPSPEDRTALDAAYAEAMQQVAERYPEDADVGALYAEALMDLRPWDQWTADGEPQPGTREVLDALEAVFEQHPSHLLALHLYIHAVEASPRPDLAVDASNRLRDLPLRLGHLVHMPSHIDVRMGAWPAAIAANERAIEVDRDYRQAAPEQEFYRTYMAHNHHMLAFAAMMRGQNARATRAIEEMLKEIPPNWAAENGPFIDAFFAMPYEMHLRFGRWEAMLAEPEPPTYLPVSRAVRLYARGVALAAQKNPRAAREEQMRFREQCEAIPEETLFVLNTAADVLSVADAVLEGEILYRQGRVDDAIAALEMAVVREDGLRYIEPPDWIQPARHVLGATLSDAGRWTAAEKVYRDDLVKHPHNGWSLFGLTQALRHQNRSDEANRVHAEFVSAWVDADTKLTSSCLCLPARE
ncbi:MAG: hypothetical protein KDA75_03080 [Planctomycetaceae bacterium]|nr:hypothetical protein [Planctomycetaceae bacterium]